MITVTKHTITKDDIGKACLIPNTKPGYEKVSKMKNGKDVVIEVKSKINAKYFRLLWGLARALSCHSNEDSYFSNKNEYIIIKSLQMEVGDTIIIKNVTTGEMQEIPDSLSYTNKKINDNYEMIENKLFKSVASILCVSESYLRKNYIELL